MPTPLPAVSDVLLHPPDEAEVGVLARGITTAVAPEGGLTHLQNVLISAVSESMTGHTVDLDHVEPIGPAGFAAALAHRNLEFRTRIVQLMVLGELVLVPLPEYVAARVEDYARELCVDEGMLRVARDYAKGSLGLALIDFDRAGYTHDWSAHEHDALHAGALEMAWQECVNDVELADRWRALEALPDGTLGRGVSDFYRARGFAFPGTIGSAPPLLAQHDWVHVLADYGTRVESELEVFALIARAIPDPRGFSLLAMVVSLFETGYMIAGAGLFQYDRGHLSVDDGMAVRVADAMYRGAVCGRDLLAVDWFEYADWPVEDVRRELGIVEKSAKARAARSIGPWEPGGISPFQLDAGRKAAEAEGREYDAFGACL
jgi:hypothetical protein